jgi:hypothetical protein
VVLAALGMVRFGVPGLRAMRFGTGFGVPGLGSEGLGAGPLCPEGLGAPWLDRDRLGADRLCPEGFGAPWLGTELLATELLGARRRGAELLGARRRGAELLGAELLAAEGLGVQGLGVVDIAVWLAVGLAVSLGVSFAVDLWVGLRSVALEVVWPGVVALRRVPGGLVAVPARRRSLPGGLAATGRKSLEVARRGALEWSAAVGRLVACPGRPVGRPSSFRAGLSLGGAMATFVPCHEES